MISIQDLFQTTAIACFTVDDENRRILYSTNHGGAYDVWELNLDSLETSRVTFSKQHSSSLFTYDGRVFATFDHDGDEHYQWHRVMDDGQIIPLSEEENESTAYFSCFTSKGHMYYSTDHSNPLINVMRYDVRLGTKTLVLEGETAPVVCAAVAPDESSYVYTESYSNTHVPAYCMVKGVSHPIIPDAVGTYSTQDVLYDGCDRIYFLTDYDSDFHYLASYKPSTGLFQKELSIEGENMKWLCKAGDELILSTEKGARDHVHRYNPKSGSCLRIAAPCATFKQLKTTTDGTLLLLGSSAHSSDAIYRMDLDEHWECLTPYRVKNKRVKPVAVEYPSFDGLTIEGILYCPGEPNGVTVLWPHGGPQKSERLKDRPLLQYLALNGYTILAPNFRGSIGYGASFMKRVEGDWGVGPRLDCVAGMDWLIEQGLAEKGRIAVMGGSYGGYMSLLLSGIHPEYFCGTVDIFGISDLISYVEAAPETLKPLIVNLVGDPVRQREKLVAESPITYVEDMAGPMLIIHGKNDTRVRPEESERIVGRLRERGIPFQYILLEDEGHSFSKHDNEVMVYQEIKHFLDTLL
ncbi:S9 family peptidase [Rossellomorea marisflavi]|uniref:S9 family peptidase n=1 Tax=Rossellomorea marisflavi TaxID=189381 RepID=UPI0034588A8F